MLKNIGMCYGINPSLELGSANLCTYVLVEFFFITDTPRDWILLNIYKGIRQKNTIIVRHQPFYCGLRIPFL